MISDNHSFHRKLLRRDTYELPGSFHGFSSHELPDGKLNSELTCLRERFKQKRDAKKRSSMYTQIIMESLFFVPKSCKSWKEIARDCPCPAVMNMLQLGGLWPDYRISLPGSFSSDDEDGPDQFRDILHPDENLIGGLSDYCFRTPKFFPLKCKAKAKC